MGWHQSNAKNRNLNAGVDSETMGSLFRSVVSLCAQNSTRMLMLLPSSIDGHFDYHETPPSTFSA